LAKEIASECSSIVHLIRDIYITFFNSAHRCRFCTDRR
jgi:hypothetical protein